MPAPVAAPPHAPPVRQHAATAAERAARVAALSGDERTRLRGLRTHLREGRRRAHADDHEGALRELQAALALAPSDSTVLCEAGLQAQRLGQLEEAATLLARGILRAVRPSTKAACLYNLGRVLEDQQNFIGARQVYGESLVLRANEIVRARLASLPPTEEHAELDDDDVEGWAEEEYGLDVDELERDEPFASLDAVCAEVANDGCWPAQTHWAPSALTATVRELALLNLQSDEERLSAGYLFVRSDEGWRSLGVVTSADTTDDYGRLESYESVDAVRFEAGAVIVETHGTFDEPEGEADAYWECEREHPDDAEAQAECFADASEGMPEPETWTTTFRFVVVDGRLRAD